MDWRSRGALVVAHEIKAPLALLRQLALSLDLETDTVGRARIQERMVATSEKAMRQVDDLLKVARLEDGLFEMEPVGVRGVCDEVIQELDSLYRFNRRRLEVSYRNRSRLVVANRGLLRSVIYNFCLNAMHYSGEETLSELIVCDVKDKVRVRVRDYGPELPKDLRKAIRTGFLKQPTSVAMRPGSSGMGLYIASQFIEYMSGHFGVERHKDGTSFYVDLHKSSQMSLV
jgi:signal transduction histidine kinase